MTMHIVPTVILCAAPWVILLMWWRDVRWWRRHSDEWQAEAIRWQDRYHQTCADLIQMARGAAETGSIDVNVTVRQDDSKQEGETK
jgi:hypothetical protein